MMGNMIEPLLVISVIFILLWSFFYRDNKINDDRSNFEIYVKDPTNIQGDKPIRIALDTMDAKINNKRIDALNAGFIVERVAINVTRKQIKESGIWTI